MLHPFQFGKDVFDPTNRFVTSWLLPPWALLLCLYSFTAEIFILAWDCAYPELDGCSASRSTFSYFTVLTYWGISFYFLVSSIHTLTYIVSGTPLLSRFPRLLQALHSLSYTTVIVYPFIVTVIYWGVLYSSPWFPTVFGAWSNISQHAMNSLFALIEILLTRTETPLPIHMLWLIVILAIYCGLAYVTHAIKGVYVYSFLDPGKNGKGVVAGYILGIAVGSLVVFGAAWGLIWTRRWVAEKKFAMIGKFAIRDKTGVIMEMRGTGSRIRTRESEIERK
ncbi:hypothetical protein DL546_009482 [Coniochaeta pulveracea]|uniref:FAR-17a/AIG1-like protein n=1 Tax=Coniochaeta pulveracea TaxID=177199 RepID=A0A420YKI9_9PEZI|nr:hypothetical protein DL546_009482 [Coniochaeta pulveracea]